MAVNFPNSPFNGEQFTANGVTYQWNSTTSLWEISLVTVPTDVNQLTDESALLVGGGGGQGVTAYTNMSDLPMTGNSTGAMAFITSTNGLFIWNGATWYGVTVQSNTGPTISSVQDASSGTAPFTLSTAGAATVVTVTATDPEGAPLTYSYSVTSGSLTNGGGTTATVTQNGNVFTVTPTTTEDYAGTFELTFTASDGELSDTSAASFTLQFALPTKADTKQDALLLTTSGSAGGNSVFTDSSANALTINPTGNPSSQSFSPYRSGGYSLQLDGNDYITPGFNDNFGTGDFTFECWVKTTVGGIIMGQYDGGSQMEAFEILTASGIMSSHTDSGTEGGVGTKDLRDNQWHHLVWERHSGTYYYYADGELQGTLANTENGGQSSGWYIGRHGTENIGYYTGEIRDLKFTVGTAVYGGTTPSVPTETTISGTETFVFATGLPYGKDLSTNGGSRTITYFGDPKFVPDGPYDYATYDTTKHGGSIYLDGTGDQLSCADNSGLELSSNDFTIETWVNWKSHYSHYGLFRKWDGTNGYELKVDNNRWVWQVNTTTNVFVTSWTAEWNRWYHIALVRSGSTTTLYIDGKAFTSGISVDPVDTSVALEIGYTSQGYNLNAYISDFRVINGTAVYTTDFTPPTEPLSSTGAALHIVGTDANIYDATQTVNPVTLVGNATASTTQTKYLSSSMYFDGTGDYIDTGKNLHANFGTGDFTVEAWVYLDETISSNRAIFGSGTSDSNDEFTLLLLSNGSFYFDWGDTSTQYIQQAGATFTANAWHHVAVTRSGTQLDIWLDGTSVVSNSSHSFNYAGTSTFKIGMARNGGMYWKGYIEDVRVTNGLARYTEAFTVPTESLLTYTPPPAAAGASSFTFTGGDFTGTSTNAFTYSSNALNNTSGASKSDGIQNGKVYFEVDITSISNVAMGLYPSSISDFGFTTAGGASIDSITGDIYPGPVDENATITNGSVLMFAADATAQKVWIGVNGTWTTATGDPATGSGISTSGASGETYVFAVMSGSSLGSSVEATILTSGGLNYTVPTGFSALADVATAAWYGDRGVFNKGSDGSTVNTLEYVDITTPSNSTDFGDLTVARYFAASCSDATSGVWHGGSPYTTTIDYVTIATTGNATYFGDITLAQSYAHAGCSDGTYGVFGGIATATAGVNTMDYITVASPGNATDFGDLTLAKDQAGACADATYGLFFAGNQEGVGRTNNIDYITIASPGNATDFGDVGTAATGVDGCSDTTRGLMGGGITASAKVNTIEYVTIATPSNATDFGDLTQARYETASCASSTYAIWVGGRDTSNAAVNTIDYVTIQTTGNATDFGDATSVMRWGAGCSGSPS